MHANVTTPCVRIELTQEGGNDAMDGMPMFTRCLDVLDDDQERWEGCGYPMVTLFCDFVKSQP